MNHWGRASQRPCALQIHREGALTSGTAVADLERDGGGFLRGLERKMRGLSVVGIWRGIVYSENAPLAYCTL